MSQWQVNKPKIQAELSASVNFPGIDSGDLVYGGPKPDVDTGGEWSGETPDVDTGGEWDGNDRAYNINRDFIAILEAVKDLERNLQHDQAPTYESEIILDHLYLTGVAGTSEEHLLGYKPANTTPTSAGSGYASRTRVTSFMEELAASDCEPSIGYIEYKNPDKTVACQIYHKYNPYCVPIKNSSGVAYSKYKIYCKGTVQTEKEINGRNKKLSGTMTVHAHCCGTTIKDKKRCAETPGSIENRTPKDPILTTTRITYREKAANIIQRIGDVMGLDIDLPEPQLKVIKTINVAGGEFDIVSEFDPENIDICGANFVDGTTVGIRHHFSCNLADSGMENTVVRDTKKCAAFEMCEIENKARRFVCSEGSNTCNDTLLSCGTGWCDNIAQFPSQLNIFGDDHWDCSQWGNASKIVFDEAGNEATYPRT